MEPPVTVIITTRNRSEMLVDALKSVRRQTGLASVARVIVSENGETGDSEEVCKRFTDLPLWYVRQQPPVSSLLHIRALWHHVESPIVAILHDDDWWLPEHLENSVRVLEKHSDCVATFSNFLDSLGPKIVPIASVKAWRVWMSSGGDFSPDLLTLDKVSVLLACLLESSFHYSTMVGRKDAVWECDQRKVASDHAWDNERTFPVFLSALGSIGYLTRHAAVVRNHPAQEGLDLTIAAAGFSETRVRTTDWLAQLEPENTALAVKKFNEAVSKLPRHLAEAVPSQIEEAQKTLLIKKFGFNFPHVSPKDAKWWLNQFCPPAVLALQRKARQILQN